MSTPPTLELPPCASAYRLATDRGEFAVHDARPEQWRGTALLVPGFTGSKEDFIGLLAPLAASGFRVVAVDGRGQFESPGPREESAYARRELAQDVLAQTRALTAAGGPESGPVHLLGHSLGGLVTRSAVLADPAPFASLTLMSSGPAAVAPAQCERLRMLVTALGGMDMAGVWRAMRELEPLETPRDASAAAFQDFLRQRWMATVPEQLIATAGQLLTEPDRVAELAGLGLPMHVISGEVDYAWPVPTMDAMAARLRAHRTVVPDAEHSPNAEQPAVTAAALAGFWLRTPATPGDTSRVATRDTPAVPAED
ncbi:alpha/beta fold hydrolase [Streptomyces sp. NPDC059740]|uniref:alpha/beta fold hydrolase n=1 Tax=Streptomyces sp. NPDC059740 TaxID=3346926 RepID=UPI003657B22B